MRLRDARRLPQAAQEEVRRRAVALCAEGRSQGEVAALLDVSRQSVNEWVAAYRAGGDQALAARRRGRRQGEKTVLSKRQQAEVQKAIREKNPDQLKLPGFLWTRALVRELIERRYGITLSEKSVGRYLRVWGFSPQRPARRALEQDPDAVEEWLEERYPAIVARAHREKARISWADEMGLRSDHTAGRSWAPVGQTPLVAGTGQRFGTNVISAISNKGHLQFMVFKQRFVAAVFIAFLTRLIRQAGGQKIVLILDGHPVHRAAKVRKWVEAHAELIELEYLPGYSPELNPDELLNQDVKSNALGRRRPHSQAELMDDTRAYLPRPNAAATSSPATSTVNTSATPRPHHGCLLGRSNNRPNLRSNRSAPAA